VHYIGAIGTYTTHPKMLIWEIRFLNQNSNKLGEDLHIIICWLDENQYVNIYV